MTSKLHMMIYLKVKMFILKGMILYGISPKNFKSHMFMCSLAYVPLLQQSIKCFLILTF